MEYISDIMFTLSSGLLFPVVVGLLILLGCALVHCVVWFVEYNRFMGERKRVQPILDSLNKENVKEKLTEISTLPSSVFVDTVCLLVKDADCAPAREHLLANKEVDVDKLLGRSRLFIKFGPMMGLMGTLIPMGPALTGLASGDVASMAYNMEMAFATTVLGMLIAAIGVLTFQVGRRCYARILNDLDFVNEMIGRYE